MDKLKPILFNTDMVRAILDGRKTVTRRVVKPQPDKHHKHFVGWVTSSTDNSDIGCAMFGLHEDGGCSCEYAKPKYQIGDVLYVRETFFCDNCMPDCLGREDENECPFNRIGDKCYGYKTQYIDSTGMIKWHPSIHMPKEAARIFLKVTDVRVERLQEITEDEAIKEGFKHGGINEYWIKATNAFIKLWNSTIKKTRP